jgi:hypothetical protein
VSRRYPGYTKGLEWKTQGEANFGSEVRETDTPDQDMALLDNDDRMGIVTDRSQ